MVDEASVSMSFCQWLASVTERIQQTMHYQFDGRKSKFPQLAPWSSWILDAKSLL